MQIFDDIARVCLGNQQIRAVDVKDGVRGVDQGGHIVGSRYISTSKRPDRFRVIQEMGGEEILFNFIND